MTETTDFAYHVFDTDTLGQGGVIPSRGKDYDGDPYLPEQEHHSYVYNGGLFAYGGWGNHSRPESLIGLGSTIVSPRLENDGTDNMALGDRHSWFITPYYAGGWLSFFSTSGVTARGKGRLLKDTVHMNQLAVSLDLTLPQAKTDIRDYCTVIGDGLKVWGKFTVPYASDIRLKDINDNNKPDCVDLIKSMGDVVSFRYKNDTSAGMNLDTEHDHTGLIYQNAVKANIPNFTGESPEGYGWINYLASDYQAVLLGAIQQLTKRVEELEHELKTIKQKQ